MQQIGKDFVLAVQAPAYPLGGGRFAMESAFVPHLKQLKADLVPPFARLVVFCPTLSDEHYAANRGAFAELSASEDGIALSPALPANVGKARFWIRELIPFLRRLRATLGSAGYVQGGLASDIWTPFLAFVNAAAWLRRIPTTFVVDIDFRKTSRRFHEIGVWNRKSYLTNRLLHDPLKRLQVWLAVRMSDLVLLKSPAMVADYGRGRSTVKDFLDAAHSARDVVSDDALEARLAAHKAAGRPLELVYFGRMVPYKGLDHVIDALEIAAKRGRAVRLTLVGAGACLPDLKERAQRAGLGDLVTFLPPVPYGAALFDLIDRADVAVAAPKVEDTPRAALDAMARGLPLVAFDIDYFQNLAQKSGAVTLAAWPSADSLSAAITALADDPERVADMARKAVVFARANTQEIWLSRRRAWTLAAYEASAFARRRGVSQAADGSAAR